MMLSLCKLYTNHNNIHETSSYQSDGKMNSSENGKGRAVPV